MKKVAKELREEDAKRWTQKRLAGVFGVARSTVEYWFAKTDRSNDKTVITSKDSDTEPDDAPAPDARVKLSPKDKPIIAARVAAGETQEQVAADYGVSQRTVSTIVKAEAKQAEAAKARTKAAKSLKSEVGVFTGDFRKIGDDAARPRNRSRQSLPNELRPLKGCSDTLA